jgi:hypothetical protein
MNRADSGAGFVVGRHSEAAYDARGRFTTYRHRTGTGLRPWGTDAAVTVLTVGGGLAVLDLLITSE